MGTSRTLAVQELLISAHRLVYTSEASSPQGIDEGWNQRTILGHLGDVDEQVWLARIDLMVKASRLKNAPPAFAWWEPDPVETAKKYTHYSHAEVVAKLLSTRSAIVEKLNSLKEQDWEATAIHATFGEIDIVRCVALILAHDDEHSTSIEKVRLGNGEINPGRPE